MIRTEHLPMRFNFPKQEEAVLVHIKLKPTMFEAIKDIAEKEECLRSDAITVLLEAAIGEYYKQAEPTKKSTAYPLPPGKEDSPDDETVPQKPQEVNQPQERKLTEEEKAEKKRAYQREYMRKYNQRKRQGQAQPVRPIIKSEWQTKVEENRKEENLRLDTAIGENVKVCPNDPCVRGGKFVVGTGYTESGIEYCSKTCLDVTQSNDTRAQSLAPEYTPAI